ncbi:MULTISPECIES: shikimate dehydrogenase [Vibrio]|uniref:Shikimate dehydrogenase (NADP(+)) n=2 Tax=Vibrio campbellii TaxID=680 RepID=A0AAQ3B0R6_9VIBR|nr:MULTISPECIES: shikimate dehydrogenase [Vibrio]ARV71300.1 shikimate dehydrogenase [Vibrio campbellii CAIM 519 = NBRC 15631 = ATCC 25920]AUW03441.1 shikimate dehydrogenase (NADP+) [Vibrio campbellii]AXB32797.1 shikimate dehydrogenase (NADP+) [Vibrio campbellii]ELU49960.1 shikimate 5-dehydrogenase [Vibrio campbellii CAIM 519 = NBRC 15631 = ATCC 25920]MCE7732575.1 shikimate dehydrogenase [Vibrio campbellii]|tara:strand:+ start:420 stop:1253 length:834 start_codon:yes stop_codon:yes gene_type:complete
MTLQIDRYAVFGNPIGHSKSPFIHTLFARQTNQSLVYTAETAPVDGFVEAAKAFFADDGKGCNVTVPFKEDAYRFANRLTERAELAGAVNTLKKLDDGEIIGDNTDGEGLVQDLLQHQVVLEGARILVIGAGGAARGVIKPLLDQKPASLTITNRTFSKAQQLADLFVSHGPIVAKEMTTIEEAYDVIINSTSASLNGELPAVSSAIFSTNSTSYDMMYGKGLTSFNQWAKEHGAAHAYDGLGMLVGQAAESFMLWRGLRPGAKQILRELRKNLEGQ